MIASNWQSALKNAVTDVRELYRLLELNVSTNSDVLSAQQDFSCRVPHPFIARMKKGDAKDPLLLQVMPVAQEMRMYPGFSKDPVAESAFNPVPGLLHKYPNRVLLTLAGACAVNCRYCFRRHFPYEDNMPGQYSWSHVLDYINENPAIDEVILSGGDPLLLKDELLGRFIAALSDAPFVKRLRIHTRLPVVIPARITNELITLLSDCSLQTVFVIHCNHPNEVDEALKNALEKFKKTSVTILNQSVLLKDVNDDSDTLTSLSLKLFEAGVMPYYLHELDQVSGAGHFFVSKDRIKAIMQGLKEKLPGYLVPKFAKEVPGMKHKQY